MHQGENDTKIIFLTIFKGRNRLNDLRRVVAFKIERIFQMLASAPKDMDEMDQAEIYFARRKALGKFGHHDAIIMPAIKSPKNDGLEIEYDVSYLVKYFCYSGIFIGMAIAGICYMRMMQCFYVMNYPNSRSIFDLFFDNRCDAYRDYSWIYNHFLFLIIG